MAQMGKKTFGFLIGGGIAVVVAIAMLGLIQDYRDEYAFTGQNALLVGIMVTLFLLLGIYVLAQEAGVA